MFAHLSDEQVDEAYASLGGIARSVLLLQARGTSLADLRSRVKDKIVTMGEAGWKVRRSAACAARAARAWAARAACFWQGYEGAPAGHDQTPCALALSIQGAAAMNLMLHGGRVALAQASLPHCLSLACHVSTVTCVPHAGGVRHPEGRHRLPRGLRSYCPLGCSGGGRHPTAFKHEPSGRPHSKVGLGQ